MLRVIIHADETFLPITGGVSDGADISANKEAENWKYYIFVRGSPRVDPKVGSGFSGLHDGAGEAAALLQQGEARLGEGRRGLLGPGSRPSGGYTSNTGRKKTPKTPHMIQLGRFWRYV